MCTTILTQFEWFCFQNIDTSKKSKCAGYKKVDRTLLSPDIEDIFSVT